MNLEAVQRAIHEVVRGTRTAETAAAELGVDARRLSIYRDFARGHVRSAFQNVFGLTRQLISRARGEPNWDALVADYISACPPSHWTLNAAAESFPEYLETLTESGRVDPFEVALAQFEWEQHAVLVDPADVVAPSEGVALNPTLSVLQLPYPVVPFVVAFEADPATPTPDPEAAMALLFRSPTTHNCVYRSGTDALLLVIKIVHESLPLEAVAEAVGHPVSAIAALVDEAAEMGLILRA